MAKIRKKLQCFDVNILDERLTSELDIFTEIMNLIKDKTVEERYRRLNSMDEDGAGDFIANYRVIDDEMLMACFISLKKGVALEVQKAFFSKMSFELSELEIQEKQEVEGHIKDYTHFLLTKDFMILKISQGIKVDRIDTYLNWLLKREKFQKVGREVFNFVEHFKPEVDINDIASFALGDDLHINKNDIFKQTLTATKEVLNKILCACNMDVDLNNVFDAFITFKIKKVAREDSNKKKKVIQTLLKELKDANLTVFNKNGQPMHLDKIKSTKEVSITHTESGFPDEAELEKEMLVYLQEILNEKNNDAN